MSEETKSVRSPVLLKKITVNFDLEEIFLQANVVKITEIGLLQWALMAPLATLKPQPSLDEIAHELGIEKVEFLQKVAEELKTMGIVGRKNDHSYYITQLGEELFSRGKIVSDKRRAEFSILYEPMTKEWLKGYSLPSKKDADYTTHSQEDDILIETDIGVPPKVLNDHVHKTHKVEKAETILDSEVQGKIIRTIDVEANILLKQTGLEIRSISNSFGDHNNVISQALKNQILYEDKLEDYLKEIIEFENRYHSIGTFSFDHAGDVKIFSPIDIEKAIDVINRPSWIAVGVESCLERAMNMRPKVIVSMFNRKPAKTNNIIIPNIVHIHIHELFPNILIASDQYSLILRTVDTTSLGIPVIIAEKSDPCQTDMLIEAISAMINSDPDYSFNLLLAKLYLQPNKSNFDQVCDYLSDYLTSSPSENKLNANLINDILIAKAPIGVSIISDSEKRLYETILKAYSLDDLLKLDESTIDRMENAYAERMIDAINSELDQSTIKGIIQKYNQLISKAKKISNKALSTRFESTIKEVIRKTVNKLGDICPESSEENIGLLFALSNIIDDKDQNLKIAMFTYRQINRGEYTAEKLESWYNRLKDLGFAFTPDDIDYLCQKKLKDFKFDWLKEDTYRKLQYVHTLAKKLLPYYSIENTVPLPELENNSTITDKIDIKGIFENIAELKRIYPEMSNAWIKERVNAIEKSLRDTQDTKNIDLWLTFIDKAYAAQKKNNCTYLDLSGKEIVEILSGVQISDIERNKPALKSIGVYEQVKSAGRQEKKIAIPPIERIVIDGSNVAGDGSKSGEESAAQLMRVYVDLKSKGFKEIYVIVGARLRHYLKDEYGKVVEFYDDISKTAGYQVLQQAPAGTSDDHFVIQYSVELDALILSNDLYRDYKDKHPEYRGKIEQRLVKYMFDPKNNSLIISEYPEYHRAVVE